MEGARVAHVGLKRGIRARAGRVETTRRRVLEETRVPNGPPRDDPYCGGEPWWNATPAIAVGERRRCSVLSSLAACLPPQVELGSGSGPMDERGQPNALSAGSTPQGRRQRGVAGARASR